MSEQTTAATVSRPRSGLWLAGFIVVCEAVGAVSGLMTAHGITTWYPTLHKPGFTPPDSIFAPVWTVLFALMGIAAWLVWRLPDSRTRSAGLGWFAAQLALNFAWTLIFFRAHLLFAAALEILILLFAIVMSTVLFGRVSRGAAWLMTPYALWVGFATALSWALWRLNG